MSYLKVGLKNWTKIDQNSNEDPSYSIHIDEKWCIFKLIWKNPTIELKQKKI